MSNFQGQTLQIQYAHNKKGYGDQMNNAVLQNKEDVPLYSGGVTTKPIGRGSSILSALNRAEQQKQLEATGKNVGRNSLPNSASNYSDRNIKPVESFPPDFQETRMSSSYLKNSKPSGYSNSLNFQDSCSERYNSGEFDPNIARNIQHSYDEAEQQYDQQNISEYRQSHGQHGPRPFGQPMIQQGQFGQSMMAQHGQLVGRPLMMQQEQFNNLVPPSQFNNKGFNQINHTNQPVYSISHLEQNPVNLCEQLQYRQNSFEHNNYQGGGNKDSYEQLSDSEQLLGSHRSNQQNHQKNYCGPKDNVEFKGNRENPYNRGNGDVFPQVNCNQGAFMNHNRNHISSFEKDTAENITKVMEDCTINENQRNSPKKKFGAKKKVNKPDPKNEPPVLPSHTSSESNSRNFSISTQKMPAGVVVEVQVSWIENPSKFWVQLLEMSHHLENLQLALDNTYKNSKSLERPLFEKGAYCVAQFTDEKWYRAKVVQFGSESKVIFIDYGNTDIISSNKLRPLRNDLWDLPAQAITVGLAHIQPSTGTTWNLHASNLLQNAGIQGKLNALVVEEDEIPLVILTDQNTGKSVNEVIIERGHGFATRKTPEIVVPLKKSLENVPFSKSHDNAVIFKKTSEIHISSTELKDLKPGCHLSVVVPFVVNPSAFWIWSNTSEITESLQKLQEMQDRFVVNPAPITFQPKVGDICGNQYSDGSWYRARVQSVHNDKCNIYYIDFGNQDSVSYKDLYPLNPTLSMYPPSAIYCRLAGVQSLIEGVWADAAVAYFKSLAENKKFDAHVVSVHNKWITVELKGCDDGLSLSDCLIDMGYAVPENASVKTENNYQTVHTPIISDSTPLKDSSSPVNISMSTSQNKVCKLNSESPPVNTRVSPLHNKIASPNSTSSQINCNVSPSLPINTTMSPFQNKKASPNSLSQINGNLSPSEKKMSKSNSSSPLANFIVSPIPNKSSPNSSNTNINPLQHKMNRPCSITPSKPKTNPESRIMVSNMSCVNLSEGQQLTVSLQNFESLQSMYVQDSDEKTQVAINELRSHITEVCKGLAHQTYSPIVGELACALFEDNFWYRVRVDEILKDTVRVFFCDYGNSDVIISTNIRKISHDFCRFPLQAIKCRVTDIPSEELPGDALDAFVTKLQQNFNRPCSLVVQRCLGDDGYLISLNDSSGFNLNNLLQFSESGGSVKASPSNSCIKSIGKNGYFINDLSSITLTVGSTYFLVVHSIMDPNLIFCNGASIEQATELKNFISKMTEHYSNVPFDNTYHPAIEEICAIQFSEDRAWYRGWIIKFVEVDKAQVLFLDFGNMEVRSMQHIRRIHPQFMELPAQALGCKLGGISPVIGNDWPLQTTLRLTELMPISSVIRAYVTSQEGENYVIEVTQVSQKPMPINQMLVNLKLAKKEL